MLIAALNVFACDFGGIPMALAGSGAQDPPKPSLPPLEAWPVLARDEMTTTREFYESVTNTVTGQVSPKAHRIIEVASGLNYQDDDGNWKPSQSLLELTADGGCAGLQGVHRVRLQPNLVNYAIQVVDQRYLGSATGYTITLTDLSEYPDE